MELILSIIFHFEFLTGSHRFSLHRCNNDSVEKRRLDTPSCQTFCSMFPDQRRSMDQLGGRPKGRQYTCTSLIVMDSLFWSLTITQMFTVEKLPILRQILCCMVKGITGIPYSFIPCNDARMYQLWVQLKNMCAIINCLLKYMLTSLLRVRVQYILC